VTLGELLELLRHSILNDRTDRISGSSDYLWTDKTLCIYINEAQRRFAVRSLILRDGTTDEVTLVPLVAGQTVYNLHNAVIAVVSAKTEGQNAGLSRVGHSFLESYRSPAARLPDPTYFSAMQPGATLAFSTDEAINNADGASVEQVTLRIFPAPTAEMVTANTALRLRVIRKPLYPLIETSTGATPEIPEDHHIEMLDWAAYLALRIVDDDAGAPKRADEFRIMFEGHVAEARKLAMRKMFAPTGWGFGRGGFVWERD